MSGRNRASHIPLKGAPHGGIPSVHEALPVARGLGLGPHPALVEDIRDPPYGMGRMGPRQLPPHRAIIEEQLAAQHDEIQGLLIDNQRLAATHVALKQEVEAVQFELHRAQKYAGAFHAENDSQMRELYEKAGKIEMDLGRVDAIRTELMQVHADIKELTASRKELMREGQAMTEDLGRMNADLQQVPAIRAEIEGLKHELQRARAAIEYEKKGYAANYEHGQVMEKKLVGMKRELETLRAEFSNAEKRAIAAAAGNSEPGYGASYGNPESGYAGNPYPSANYGSNPTTQVNLLQPMQAGAEGYPQYVPGPGAWGAYEMQRSQGPR